MDKPKKIGLADCDSDLRIKLEGLIKIYNGETAGNISDTALNELIVNINQDLDLLKNSKLDTIVATNDYFNKTTEKVTSSMLDDDLARTVNRMSQDKYRTTDDKITYSELAADITDIFDNLKERMNTFRDSIIESGDSSALFADSINELSNTVKQNKANADTGINENKSSIQALDLEIDSLKATVNELNINTLKVDAQLSTTQMPNEVTSLIEKLGNSEEFTLSEKNKLSNLADISLQAVSAYYTSNVDILQHYLNNKYSPIYYSVNDNVILYQQAEESESANTDLSNIDNDILENVKSDIIEDVNYNITALSKNDTKKLQYYILVGLDNGATYFQGKKIAQSLSKIIDETAIIKSNTSLELTTSDKISNTLELTTINVFYQNASKTWIDANDIINIERYTDKIVITNNSSNIAEFKIICTGYAY